MQLTIIECYGCNEIRASYKPLVSIPGNPPPSNSHSVLLLPLGRVSRPHPTAAANVASSLRRPKTKKKRVKYCFCQILARSRNSRSAWTEFRRGYPGWCGEILRDTCILVEHRNCDAGGGRTSGIDDAKVNFARVCRLCEAQE